MAAYEDTLPPMPANPLYTINKKVDLSPKQKLDLIIVSQNPQLNALWELMEMECIVARDNAMAISPAKPVEQVAAMTVAHAYTMLYESIKDRIRFITQEHFNETKRLDNEKKLGSPEEIERIIMNQLTNELNNM